MGLTKLLPLQGWILLAVLGAGSYLGYTALNSYAGMNRIPELPTDTPRAVSPAIDDLALTRRMLTDAADIARIDELSARMGAATPDQMAGLKAEAASLRTKAETACSIVVGKTDRGTFEILSIREGLVRPAVRCVSTGADGSDVFHQGLVAQAPWMEVDALNGLPPATGRSWVVVGEKPIGALKPRWIVPVSE